ncbi:MAG TPA: hypothetical protein VLU43_12660 [Anaeromyxobacteraceae bacterium]|nr:hypothetical protein [Anaeromyxobacteraceae bacterium]
MLERLQSILGSQLPPPGPRRWAVLLALAVGGLVAVLVSLAFAVILVGLLRG